MLLWSSNSVNDDVSMQYTDDYLLIIVVHCFINNILSRTYYCEYMYFIYDCMNEFTPNLGVSLYIIPLTVIQSRRSFLIQKARSKRYIRVCCNFMLTHLV